MTREEALKTIRGQFGDEILEVFDKSPKRLYVDISPSAIVPVGIFVFRRLGARFNIATAVDTPTHIEVLYHFTLDAIDLVITLRVKLDRAKPAIDSLATSFPAANWIEREMNELLGIDFRGHPDMRPLLLPEHWPKGSYPLRRDYQEWDPQAVRDRGV